VCPEIPSEEQKSRERRRQGRTAKVDFVKKNNKFEWGGMVGSVKL